MTLNLHKRRSINRERTRRKWSRRGLLGNAARRRNMLDDISRGWRIVRIGTWLNPATGGAAKWIIRADGQRHVSLEVNGRHVCAGAERTIRAKLANVMWNTAKEK